MERFLLAPPLAANFLSSPVAVCDISARGARFKHEKPLETGKKGVLKLPIEGRPSPLTLEAVVVWSQADSGAPGQFVSGVRTYGPPEIISSLIAQLQTSKRSNRIEELRSSDRFFVMPSLEGTYGGAKVKIENLSARGAGIEMMQQAARGTTQPLSFHVPNSELEVSVGGQIVWTSLKAISGGDVKSYRAGLHISEKPELVRLAIALLCEAGRASLDTQSLVLKLKIMRARARQFAPTYKSIEASGVPAEQYLLIQGVREELRLNPEEAMHWYRRARLIINDPKTRASAPMIADHPDALAVWEYLDRTIDASMIGRAFNLRG
ncbi:MAG TPA: PilZ domain-containing protein [Thermoanaerobaculia bacterium]|nr:PilZ domain-containing protein [Thermoanaerobaculia bacterium]